MVTRGTADQKITLTATVKKGNRDSNQDHSNYSKSSSEGAYPEAYAGYLFGHFIGEGGADQEQIYFALSEDGLNFTDMNNAKSRYSPVL